MCHSCAYASPFVARGSTEREGNDGDGGSDDAVVVVGSDADERVRLACVCRALSLFFLARAYQSRFSVSLTGLSHYLSPPPFLSLCLSRALARSLARSLVSVCPSTGARARALTEFAIVHAGTTD